MPVQPGHLTRAAAFCRAATSIIGVSIPLNGGIVAAGVLAIAAIRDRPAWARTPLDGPLAAFLLWSILAAAVSEFRQQAIPIALGLAFTAYLAYQIPYRWFRSHPDLFGIASRWACVGVVAAAGVGLATYLYLPMPHLEPFRRFILPGEPPNVLGYALSVGMLLGLGALPRHPWLATAALATGTFALVGSLSRWALIGFSLGLAVWCAHTVRRHSRAVVLAIAVVGAAAAVTLSLPLMQTITDQYIRTEVRGNRWVHALITGFTPRTGFPERLAIWRSTRRMIGDHLWFGVGPGAFSLVYKRYRDPSDATLEVPELPAHLEAAHAHNDVLSAAADAGLPAAAAYLVMLTMAVARVFRRSPPSTVPSLAALVAIMAQGLFDAVSTTRAGPLVAFWIVLAIAIQPTAKTLTPAGCARSSG